MSIYTDGAREDPAYGVHYIKTEGIADYSPLYAETINLSVKKGTFLLPCLPYDTDTSILSGELAIVPDVLITLDSTGRRTMLILVNGDGTIEQWNGG